MNAGAQAERRALALAVLVGAAHPTLAAEGDVAAGKVIFKRCAACHRVEPGRNAAGPNLHGVVGRPAGSVSGFKYSASIKSSGIIWTEAALDQWLAGPKAFIPGTHMLFPGLHSPQERADVIAYLKTLAP
jgi:cytochrome c